MEEQSIEQESAYQRWLKMEGLPVIRDYYIEDVRAVPLEPWERHGFSFKDRFDSQDGYFSGQGKSYSGRVWETNFVPDVRGFVLKDWKERGAGGRNIMFELSDNTMCSHISEFPVGTYKKAHRHGPGAHVVIIGGTGYSLMWPEGSPIRRFDWHEGSVIVPPEMWFHQHFNAGTTPARYLALRWGSKKNRFRKRYGIDKSVKEGGDQIEYQDEDPGVREMFEQALAEHGLESRMAPAYEAAPA